MRNASIKFVLYGCVDFASFDLVCNEHYDTSVPGMLVCSSFLISMCMYIVSKVLLTLSATMKVRTTECCVLYPCCVGVFCTRVAWVCFVPVLRGCVWYVSCYVW